MFDSTLKNASMCLINIKIIIHVLDNYNNQLMTIANNTFRYVSSTTPTNERANMKKDSMKYFTEIIPN